MEPILLSSKILCKEGCNRDWRKSKKEHSSQRPRGTAELTAVEPQSGSIGKPRVDAERGYPRNQVTPSTNPEKGWISPYSTLSGLACFNDPGG